MMTKKRATKKIRGTARCVYLSHPLDKLVLELSIKNSVTISSIIQQALLVYLKSDAILEDAR